MVDPIPGHEHLTGRLSIPYLTDCGPVNMTFRCIERHDCKEIPNHQKYMFPKGFPTDLFGVQSASWADEWIVIAEGELDALTWHQIGVPAFGVSGVKKWQPWWSNVLDDFSRIYVAEDGDDAGRELWDKVSDVTPHAIRMRMPDGEDTNSVYTKYGKERLLGMIKK